MSARLDNTPLAVGALISAALALAVNDAVVKSIGGAVGLWQVLALRSVFALLMLVGVAYATMRWGRGGRGERFDWRELMPRAVGWILLRSVFFTFAAASYFSSLAFLPLSIAGAIFLVAPLLVVAFAVLWAGERVPKVIWFAAGLGFAGVLAIVRPDFTAFNWYALLPLLSATLYALTMIITRVHCREENPYTLAIGMNVVLVVIGGVVAWGLGVWEVSVGVMERNPVFFKGWVGLGWGGWGVMVAIGLVITVNTLGLAYAYQNARAATLAPFEYAYLVCAVVLGFVVFGERLGVLEVVGMGMIVGAGLVAMRFQPKGVERRLAELER